MTSTSRKNRASGGLAAYVLGCLLGLFSLPALAQQCTSSAVAPMFGAYTSSGPGNQVAGSVTVSCSVVGTLPLDVFYTVQVSLGSNSQGTQRRMAFGTSFLNYNIYCDSGYSQIWADASSSTCVVTGGRSGLLGPLVTVHPLYGRIPGGQYVTPGTYSDSLQVQVLY